jgi:PAS domain S-box-containing protein
MVLWTVSRIGGGEDHDVAHGGSRQPAGEPASKQDVDARAVIARLEAELADAREVARRAQAEIMQLRASAVTTPMAQQAALLSSHGLLRGVLDSATSGIMVMDALRDDGGRIVDFVFTLANPTSERMVGLSAEEVLGRRLLDLFPGNVQSGQFAMYVEVTETGLAREIETHYQDDRLEFWLNVSAVRVGDGVAVTFTDISERKRDEHDLRSHTQALARQKAFAERVIENVTSGICYLDRDLIYRVANPIYCRFLQMDREQIIDRYLFDVVPGGEETIEPIFRRALDHGEATYVQALPFAYLTPDGTQRQTYWDATYLPMTAPDTGETGGVLVVANEISDRLEAERLKAERIVALEEANRHKEQFLSILSHELRTPINAIMGFASVLSDGVLGELSERQQEGMDRIMDGADRMLALVSDLLDMSRIQAGQFSVTFGRVNLAEVCRDAIEALRPLADRQGLTVVDETVAAASAVRGDAQRLEQVVMNLLSNAIKFTPPGGTVTLRTRLEGDHVRVEVADTGVGIPPAEQARIFEAFTQVDMSYTRRAGGSGLGLTISRSLIEAHGGQIGVESEPGGGSTFWFTLAI